MAVRAETKTGAGGRIIQGIRLFAATMLALAVTGCETNGTLLYPPELGAPVSEPTPPQPTPTMREPGDVKYFPSDEPLHMGNEQFARGNYGLAERYYQDAVEKAPRDVTAWIGLAASYDRIGRFDLADRAYAAAIKLNGETTEILNNEGYSYMLRGDFVRARKKLLKAYQRDPNNPTIANNLKLLDGSSNVVRRSVNP
jgi:tetratricopeptide (TPR) repeat protein